MLVLSAAEDLVQRQDEELSVRKGSERRRDRERAGTVEEMRQLLEPAALTEHREKKWESTPGWYWPLGTVSSLTQTSNFLGSAKEHRLHNRWMQLSMQAEALLALSEYRRTGSSTVKYSAFHHSGLSSEADHSGAVSVFHPLGSVRVVWDMLGLFLLLADAILLPVSLAWNMNQGTQEPGEIFLFIVFMFGLMFWSLDIFMNFNTAFYLRGHLVLSRIQIVKHYLKTWLLACTKTCCPRT